MAVISIVPLLPLVLPVVPAVITQPWLGAPAMFALQFLALG